MRQCRHKRDNPAYMAQVALSDWMTIPEAAEYLGASTRTVERRIAAGDIQARTRPRTGKRPETVCHPADVDKLLPGAHVVSNPVVGHRAPETALQRIPIAQIAPIPPPKNTVVEIGAVAVPITEKLWLDLDEACAYSGLGRSILKRLAKPVGPRGALRIHRKALEEFTG